MHSVEDRVVYQFGPFLLDPAGRRLTREGEPLCLTPKALDVLVALVEARGAVVGRETLMDRVWPDTAVVDANLTQTISVLRKTLGDTASEHLYVATVPGRGYQFTAAARAIADSRSGATAGGADPAGASGPGRSSSCSPSAAGGSRSPDDGRPLRSAIALFLLLAVLCVSALLIASTRGDGSPDAGALDSLAVLPLTVTTPDAVDPALGVGLSDAITNRLSNHRSLVVRPTQAVLAASDGESEPLAVGRELRADFVLTGTIRQAGDQVRASVQLFDVDREQPLWAATFDQPVDALFRLEDGIAGRIAHSLAVNLAESTGSAGRSPTGGNGAAYLELILGRARCLDRCRNGYEAAIGHFERALEHDPDYAPALGHLALTRTLLASNGRSTEPSRRLLRRAVPEARRAIRLDPELPEAHMALGMVRMNGHYDWPGAVETFERAVALDSGHFRSRYLLSMALILAGDDERAWEEARKIRLRREVTGSAVDTNHEFSVGLLALLLERHEEAREALSRVVEASPHLGGVRMYLGICLDALGRRRAALAELETASLHFHSSDQAKATLAHYLGRSGDPSGRDRARAILAELERRPDDSPSSTLSLAVAHAGAGSRTEALRHLRRAHEAREILPILLLRDPRFDPLRDEPEFLRLLDEMDLAPAPSRPDRLAKAAGSPAPR